MARFAVLVALLAVVSVSAVKFDPWFNPNATDICLSNVNKFAELTPKIIDDLIKGDILNLMADISQVVPLINSTKDNCLNLSFWDVTNMTTYNTFLTCINGTYDVVGAVKQLIADVSIGDFGAIVKDITYLIGNGTKAFTICNSTQEVIAHPRFLFNFYNTSKCWGPHEHSVAVFKALYAAIQEKNSTAALPLVLPFIGSSAEAIRSCSIWPEKKTYYSSAWYRLLETQTNGTCLNDIVFIITGIQKVFEDIDSANFSSLVKDIQAIVPFVMAAVEDCKNDVQNFDYHPYLNYTFLQGVKNVAEDVVAIKPLLKSLFKDIKSGNTTNLITDVLRVILLGNKAYTDLHNRVLRNFDIVKALNMYRSDECNRLGRAAWAAIADVQSAPNKVEFMARLPKAIGAVQGSLVVCHRNPNPPTF